MSSQPPPVLLALRDSAVTLGISPRHLHRLVSSGAIRTIQLGRRRLVPREEIDRILAEARKEAQ